jgi:hypothetical protein
MPLPSFRSVIFLDSSCNFDTHFSVAFQNKRCREGSWKCEKCNNINYPFRTKCNRQNCGADKPAESTKSPSPTPDEDNQVCSVTFFLYLHLLLEIVTKFNKNFCTHNKCDKYSILHFLWVPCKGYLLSPPFSPSPQHQKRNPFLAVILFYLFLDL